MSASPMSRHPARSAGLRREPALRLTRRGRTVVAIAVFLLVLAVGVAGMLLAEVPSAAAGHDHRDQDLIAVTVQPGDTLWGFAAEHKPAGEDPRDTVLMLQQLNDLPSTGLTAGTQLYVPRPAAS